MQTYQNIRNSLECGDSGRFGFCDDLPQNIKMSLELVLTAYRNDFADLSPILRLTKKLRLEDPQSMKVRPCKRQIRIREFVVL